MNYKTLSELKRVPARGWLFGVCAGLAAFYGWRVRTVRWVIAISAILVTWPVVLAYVVAVFVLPSAEDDAAELGPSGTQSAEVATPGREAPVFTGPLRERYGLIEARMRRVEAYLHGHEYQLRNDFRDLET